MKVDEQVIRNQFPRFWLGVKDQVQFKSAGKSIKVDKTPSCGLSTLKECGSDNPSEYKFHCQAFEIRLQSDGVEKLYTGEFDLIIEVNCSGSKPMEYIKAIKDNTISVKSK